MTDATPLGEHTYHVLCLPFHVIIPCSGLSTLTVSPDLWGCGLLQSLMSQSVLAGSPLQPSTPKSASRPLTPFFVRRVPCSFLSAIPHIVPLGASHTSFSHSYALSFRRLCPKPQRGRSILKIPITHPFVPIMILINRK